MGQRIRKARLKKDLLQADLARKLMVDEMSIVNWELDRNVPSKKNQAKLRTVLSVVI